MDLELSGKVALVTGSSRGTGEAIARKLAAEGATVLVHGIGQGDAAPVAASIRQAGGNAHAINGDIATDAGADQAVAEARAAAEPIDILVNNYGTTAPGGWGDAMAEDWVAIYQKNVVSAARMIRLLLPQMRERPWGRILQIGTIGSTRPNARMPHYYAAKGALANMTVSLAKELAGSGITVNTVSPGLIKTREVEAAYRKRAARDGWGDDWTAIEARIAAEVMPNLIGRIARTEEVADLVAFLVSPRAAFITGVNVRIDGGSVDYVS